MTTKEVKTRKKVERMRPLEKASKRTWFRKKLS